MLFPASTRRAPIVGIVEQNTRKHFMTVELGKWVSILSFPSWGGLDCFK